MNATLHSEDAPHGSQVLKHQRRLREATRAVLTSIAADVRAGLSETVGIKATLVEGERAAIKLELPPQTDTDFIARAVDMENVEAWCDENGQVCVGISPWLTTKDVDQVVLSITKVIHVRLGLHASDRESDKPKPLTQRLLAAVGEVLSAQQRTAPNHKSETRTK